MVAIDGYSSCGKSTMAKAIAKSLGYSYIDTGAMYRAATLHMLNNQIPAANIEAVKSELQHLEIRFKFNPEKQVSETYLNGKNVESEIRTMRVAEQVSNYATIKEIRVAMVSQQQQMGKKKAVVLDGRDIGTVVFPEAELKIFMTASNAIRAQRRFAELKAKGEEITLQEVENNLAERDRIDSTREESPLKQAKDAKVLDNSHLNQTEQLEIALNWANEAINRQ
ncbi:MAG: (d)CMP kinase [Bacteroidetes bacterium]|nr:(d)CMP kinase [Bacteroidota bacterium]